MNKTVLYDRHVSLGAKMVDFAGWNMPIEYKSMLQEAVCCRNSAGIFDVSHMGEVEISGEDALGFLQYISVNNVGNVNPGHLQYNILLNDNAGIIDDFMLYCFEYEYRYIAIVNAANKDKDIEWLKSHSDGFNVQISDLTKEYSLIALQGPMAEIILSSAIKRPLGCLIYMRHLTIPTEFGSLLVSRSGYTGEDGFEIMVENHNAVALWDAIFVVGRQFNLCSCGLGARDILRLEAGYPLWGKDMDENTSPYQASVSWAVKEGKKNFIGKSALKKDVEKKRVGFIMKEKAFAREGYKIYTLHHDFIGEVKSGVFSPNIHSFIGSGIVKHKDSMNQNNILIEIRKRFFKAEIKKFPFVEIRTKKEAV